MDFASTLLWTKLGMKLIIQIPCLNEEKTLAATLQDLPTDIPGIDKLISHEKTGLLAPLGDKKTLSNYWIRLLNDTESTRKLSNAAFDYVNAHYSAQRMSAEYLTLFQDLITEHSLKWAS